MSRTLAYYGPQWVSTATTPTLEITFGAAPYHMEVCEGLGAPDMDVLTQALPLQNGALFSRLQYQPRLITVSGKLLGTIAQQNTSKAALSKALAYNNLAVRESWQTDFWRLRASDSGIDTVDEFIDFLFNVNGYGVLKYTSSGITPTKRINVIPYSGPVFKNKDGREPYQSFQVVFMAPYPFWEDDEYTLAINETDDEKTVDFTIGGDVPPRAVLYVEPTETTVSNSTELTITAKQNYTPGIAAAGYVPTMLDFKSTAALKDGDYYYQSFIRGEIQSYINRAGNALAVAAGSGSPYLAYSTDGKNWAAADTVLGTNWHGTAWSSSLGLFVAGGYTAPYLAYSTDGKNWAAADTVVGTNWYEIAWSSSLGLFVAGGATSPYLAYSADGKNWAAADTVLGTNWYEIAWSSSLGLFVAAGFAAPYLAYSTDGKNWAAADTVLGTAWRGIAWSSSLGLFVAAGFAAPYLAYSTDGKNWAAADTVLGTDWRGIAWSSSLGLFVAGGAAPPYLAYSTDGKNWAAADTVLGTGWFGIASFPDADDPVDTNGKLQRFKALDMPPGDYRAVMKADQDMIWKLYYRKAWMGI